MEPADVTRTIDAVISIAVALGLPADHVIVVQDSNKLALRLQPCDVFARVSPPGHEHAAFEVELAQRLAQTETRASIECFCATVGNSYWRWSPHGVGTGTINFRTASHLVESS